MAEKQNCSEPPISNNPAAKRRASLSTLSKILKSQSSSIQHKACPDIKRKPSGGLKMFFIKALIGGGAIYVTALLGVWAEAEESTKLCAKLKRAINKIDNETIMSDKVKKDLFETMNNSKEFLKRHLENMPGKMKICYEKSEKYINDLLSGKKS